MYANDLHLQIAGAERAIVEPIINYGISVYVDTDPDSIAHDFKIHRYDKVGIEIFREFAAKMAAHYKSLKKNIP
jgi:hypothetical protein